MLGQMMGERQGRFLDDAEAAAALYGCEEGERFLGQVLGSREASAQLGHAAAERAGVSLDIASQLMPAIAAMMQGGMQRQMPDDSLRSMLRGFSGGSSGRQSGGFDLGALNQMLDADGDGSALDDIREKVMR